MKRKNFFSLLSVVLLAAFVITFTSCGSNSSAQDKNSTTDVTSADVPPAVSLPTTSPATSVNIGVIEEDSRKGSGDSGAESSISTCEFASFVIMVKTQNATLSFPKNAQDCWYADEKDAGKTEELKAFANLLKEKKLTDFAVTTVMKGDREEVIKVVILPVYKDGPEGKVGTIVSEEIVLYENKQ